jgi:hypothetical protein
MNDIPIQAFQMHLMVSGSFGLVFTMMTSFIRGSMVRLCYLLSTPYINLIKMLL